VPGHDQAEAAARQPFVYRNERVRDLAAGTAGRLGRAGANEPVAGLDGTEPARLEQD
jgi:hypothetical protein